ncbi:MAG: TRAP transporter small permease subunit [Proteobacteria bacterium]|nr:TRAP transporter small permease subunit [Pseudomonadota bacterium]
MPDIPFVLPHWMYWSGLLLFPLFAMYIVRRQAKAPPRAGVSLPVGYLLWLTGGFVGIHRFYLRSLWGVVYIPLFAAIIVFSNPAGRRALDTLSDARYDLLGAEFDVERFQKALVQGAEGAAAKLANAEQALAAVLEQMVAATAAVDQWQMVSGGFATAIAVLLLIDAVLLPRLVRRRAEAEAEASTEIAGEAAPEPVRDIELAGTHEDPTTPRVGSRITDIIDAISEWSGEFVCYWSLIAVFVYYYEVLARYVFNSPTSWAHESMFLMFGMQYMISGAYAFREGSHVRVDVVYQYLPARAKAITDIVTSIFFFIFAGTLLVTGWIFLADSIDVWEVSFTEWAIQYWPVKITIVLGALLILLQGFSKLVKDFILLTRKEV